MTDERYPEFHPVVPLPAGADLVAALDFRRLPKILLHEHLDGGLRPRSIAELAKEHGYGNLPTSDPDDLARWFHRGAQKGNLPEYLEGFAHTIAVMQTRDALSRVACEFLEDMARDGVVYAEVRFAPVFHIEGGLTQDEVVEAVIAGLEEGEKRYGVEWGLIVCAMRDRSEFAQWRRIGHWCRPEQVLHRRKHQGQRGAQLVADIGKKLRLSAIELCERFRTSPFGFVGSNIGEACRDLTGQQIEEAVVR